MSFDDEKTSAALPRGRSSEEDPSPDEGAPLGKLGRYRLRRLLGKGGMAEVYLASQEGPAGFQKTVVVKRIRHALLDSPRFVEMFLREARVAARLNHVNVVTIFELAEADGEYFIAMEYLDGVPLHLVAKRLWARDQSFPMEVVLRSIADAALGLHHAHTLVDEDGRPTPLVHRDISPDNLLMTRDGVTKVLDFGIAKSNEVDEVTRTGEIKGKVPYMSPEQIRGEPLDGRADLFSLGVTLYQLLTGERPFKGAELAVLDAVLRQEPKPPRELNPLIPPALQAIVLRLLEKDREQRLSSGADLHRELLALLGPAAGSVTSTAQELVARVAVMESQAGERQGTIRTVVAARPTTPWLRARDGDTELHGELENLLPDGTPPEHAPFDAPATTVLAPSPQRGRRHAVLGGVALAAVVAALGAWAVTSSNEERAGQRLEASAASPPAPELMAPAVLQGASPPLEVAPTEEPAKPAPSSPPAATPQATSERAPARPRSSRAADEAATSSIGAGASAPASLQVEVKAPRSVFWEAPSGARLGRGSGKLKLPAGSRTVVAVETRRGVRTEVPVPAEGSIDYEALPRGLLSFRVKPWAKVYLGNTLVGTTPFEPLSVVAGRYQVRLKGESQERREVVVVEPNRHAVLKADLRER